MSTCRLTEDQKFHTPVSKGSPTLIWLPRPSGQPHLLHVLGGTKTCICCGLFQEPRKCKGPGWVGLEQALGLADCGPSGFAIC